MLVDYEDVQEDLNRYKKELEANKKEMEALKLALLDAVGSIAYIRDVHGELYGVGFDRIESYRELLQGEGK